MASHRKPRPGGTRGPGLHGPALATAAFTSVAVLSQTAEAAPADDGRPSVEEVEKKIDEFYRRADATSEEEPAARQRAHAEDPRQEGARRAGRRAKAREGLIPFAAAPDTAASLLAEFPQDHFAQNRVMNRLASRVKDTTERGKPTAERGKATSSPQTPAAAHYDVKAAKAAVQHKLATTRELLSRLTAQEGARPTAAGPRHLEEPGPRAYGPRGWRQTTQAEKAIAFARAQIGKPYVSGASGPGSYDCAGLTRAAWKAAGVTLPRTAQAQAATGTPVPLSDARAGDLVFFHDDSSHVGLCTGDGMMIHAPEPGAYVREEAVDRGGASVIHSVVRPA
ncbi:C40 family peptidase [Streptomyces sp. NPDC048521]|uniref:C40 family peptidase n=1 Tax=Streptomyces sp. NPDC048521 TaxID=3365566 RepID=UPI00371BD9B4